MICSKCRSSHSEVVNTRTTRGGGQIWRRRRCANCGKVTTTYERLDLSFLQVVCSNKNTPYRRSLLFLSLLQAFEPEDLNDIVLDNLVDTVEQKVLSLGEDSISSTHLRQLALETLKPINVNAFMRYLVTHEQFRTKSDIKAALKDY